MIISELPDRVFINDPKTYSDGETIPGTWTIKPDWCFKHEYRRADLLPTLSAAMELPEVKALVEALEYGDRMCRLDFHREINPDDECFSQAVWDTWQRMVAALAAIKEPKT